ncbi:MAG: hypothetical protein GY749_09410 [Desulfobacteraceae bacterium]|nr:hypothetical protein [Desulfobacteraceae bacterium]
MKMLNMEQTTLHMCNKEAQSDRLIITSKGKPVAIIVGLDGIDEEQLEAGISEKFWSLIEKRRKQKTVSRAELEEKINTL